MPSLLEPRDVLVIIPAYNEARNLGRVLSDVREAGFDRIVVVDDGSSDDTADVASEHAVHVLHHPYNLGVGAAVQTGYRFALLLGCRGAVQIDGDGQHDPAQIPALLEGLASGYDLVIGSRFLGRPGYRIPIGRRLGATVLAAAVSILCGRRFRDTTSGFRAAGSRTVDYLARHYPADHPEPESIVELTHEGFSVGEVPCSMADRQGGASSIRGLRSPYYMLKVLLAVFIARIRGRKRPPQEEC